MILTCSDSHALTDRSHNLYRRARVAQPLGSVNCDFKKHGIVDTGHIYKGTVPQISSLQRVLHMHHGRKFWQWCTWGFINTRYWWNWLGNLEISTEGLATQNGAL
ncbi:hypothetical protein GDO86_019033 [Hymenochirus boettgeri]|uniref:Uncharacterized protein n=1 Tax=Hymenochirus boettgeri TaxID=247094 RepID=A0A8T2I9Q6_9PIPI|nr:hypothetical protein GDO86_019033 [Hymenochirus boettgeri]